MDSLNRGNQRVRLLVSRLKPKPKRGCPKKPAKFNLEADHRHPNESKTYSFFDLSKDQHTMIEQ